MIQTTKLLVTKLGVIGLAGAGLVKVKVFSSINKENIYLFFFILLGVVLLVTVLILFSEPLYCADDLSQQIETCQQKLELLTSHSKNWKEFYNNSPLKDIPLYKLNGLAYECKLSYMEAIKDTEHSVSACAKALSKLKAQQEFWHGSNIIVK